jgi:hypothetical protein
LQALAMLYVVERGLKVLIGMVGECCFTILVF